jgi:hypothetical protein
MRYIEGNGARGGVGLIGLILMTGGAIGLWGWFAGMLVLGLFIAIDCSFDEFTERSTGITRWRKKDG